MTHVSDPRGAPEMLAVRESIRGWRFYDHFRTDAQSPVRFPQIGTWTPILGDDGSDVAAAIQTVAELGDGDLLDAALATQPIDPVVTAPDRRRTFRVIEGGKN